MLSMSTSRLVSGSRYLTLLLCFLGYSLSSLAIAQSTSAPTSLKDPSETRTSYPESVPAQTSSLSGYPYNSNPSDPEADDTDGSRNGVLNYYFLLLAVFVIGITVAYCTVARRRKRKLVLLRTNRQDALQRDLESWGGRHWGHGRWRTSGNQNTRPEEGLDERGMPPPPYIPQPQPTHPAASQPGEQAIPLQNINLNDQKPPDYAERAADSTSSATSGTPHPSNPTQQSGLRYS